MSQTERVFHILDRLRDVNRIQTSHVAEKFEVSKRTIKRDIEYIRDRLEYEILWSAEKGHYYLTRDDLGKIRQRGETELMFYALAMGFCRNRRLMPLVSQSIEEHLSSLLPRDYRDLSEHISYDLFDYPEPPARFFSLILRAIGGTNQMEMAYTSIKGTRSERLIDPLHLKNWNGQWYLVAWCHSRKEIRLFLLSRINEMNLCSSTFTPKLDGKELKKRLNNGFGIMVELNHSAPSQWVRIRFYGTAARLTEGVIWHPSQEMVLCNGVREFAFPVSSYEEILNVVFSYRDEAEVREPADLRNLWLEKIRKMAKNFL